MRTFIALILLAAVFTSCSKKNDVKPGDGNTNTGTKKPDTVATAKLSHDDSIHMAVLYIRPQIVKTSVSGKNLIMKFDENVSLFFLADAYKKTSAIHLTEDFKKTSLSGFDFTTVAEGGNTTLNWVDDNLNNVKLKTVKDTLIKGVPVVKVNVNRTFTFFKVYASEKLATDQQNLLLATTGELVTFSSFTYYNQKEYPKTSAVAYVEYLK